jgi:hypothetical protein
MVRIIDQEEDNDLSARQTASSSSASKGKGPAATSTTELAFTTFSDGDQFTVPQDWNDGATAEVDGYMTFTNLEEQA